MKKATKKPKRVGSSARGAFVFMLGSLFAVIFLAAPMSFTQAAADIWQYALNRPWEVDPIFQYGSPYGGNYHIGEDVQTAAGTPVYAVAEGKIKLLRNFPSYHNWGGLVLIEHQNSDGTKAVSLYGHLNAGDFKVSEGQNVVRGQLLGYIGNYAQNGGWNEHIHVGIRPGSYVSNPWVYYGFGSRSDLNNIWDRPSEYITFRGIYKYVERVPILARDRYETAAGVSQSRFADDTAKEVLLVSGENFPDALAATALTLENEASLLLTRTASLPTSTLNEINRVLPDGAKITIVGGGAAVSSAIESQLGGLGKGYVVSRVAGPNAEATATAVADQLPTSDTVFLANSRKFADGIAAGVPAATDRIPLLLTRDGGLSAETRNYLNANPAIENVIIVGGLQSIPQQIVDEVTALPTISSVEKIAGPDRYATTRMMMQRFVSNPKTILVATGEKFPDALTGSSLAAHRDSALLLSSFNKIKGGGLDYAAASNSSVTKGSILGGTAALSQLVEIALGSVLTDSPFTTSSIETMGVDSAYKAAKDVNSSEHLKDLGQLKLPLQEASELRRSAYRGATIFESGTGSIDSEESSQLVVTVLPATNNTPLEVLSDWFGVPADNLGLEKSLPNGLILLKGQTNLLQTTAAYVNIDDTLYLVEIHHMSEPEALKLLEQISIE